jgi:uncharacterized damage-inducible protein DinB
MMTAKNRSLNCILGVLVLVAVSGICSGKQVHQKKRALTQAAAFDEKPSSRLAVLIAQWTRAKAWTGEYIDKMPEDSFGFRPVPGVRSFAGQMLHLAFWNFAFVDRAIGQPSPYKEQDLVKDEFKTRARLSKVVTESYDFVINGLKRLSDAQLDEQLTMSNGAKVLRIERINDAYEHQTHHRGQTVIYLRLKGVMPPAEPF